MGSVPWEKHFLLQWPSGDGPPGGDLLRDPVPRHRHLRPLLRLRLPLPELPHHTRAPRHWGRPLCIRSLESPKDLLLRSGNNSEVLENTIFSFIYHLVSGNSIIFSSKLKGNITLESSQWCYRMFSIQSDHCRGGVHWEGDRAAGQWGRGSLQAAPANQRDSGEIGRLRKIFFEFCTSFPHSCTFLKASGDGKFALLNCF